MLEMTMKTKFVPGTNLKGRVAGGNWIFTLPSLELGQIVCWGVPSSATLTTLTRHAASVILICRQRRHWQLVSQAIERHGWNHVRAVLARDMSEDLIARASTDLIVVANRMELFRMAFSGPTRHRTIRWLKDTGRIYFEANGFDYRFVAPSVVGNGPRRWGQPRILWLTPACGEAHTFVPADDAVTTQFFLQKRLPSSTLRAGSLKAFQARMGRMTDGRSRDASRHEKKTRRGVVRRLQAVGKSLARSTVQATIRAANFCEAMVSSPRHLGRCFGRRGVIVERDPQETGSRLPKYLVQLAAESGISLDHFRWGLSASGDYDSRKLIFFLLPADAVAPQYVVKMTRSTLFNPRLEQETRALRLLEQKGLGDVQTLPRVAFAGEHGGLAIVGETAIDGVPFDQKSTARPDCPYAWAAFQWLTELSTKTLVPFPGQTGEVATGLLQLLERFSEIYDVSEAEHSFLREQIALIDFNSVPLVFQHGDPGRWNVLVTADGRVSFLDWEAAEPNGLPLLDLFYFLRSFCMGVLQSQYGPHRLGNLEQLLFSESPLSRLAEKVIGNYCVETGLNSRLIEPLFHICWMHRALKESTRLPPQQLQHGHYFNLLRLGIARREAPQLQRLFRPAG